MNASLCSFIEGSCGQCQWRRSFFFLEYCTLVARDIKGVGVDEGGGSERTSQGRWRPTCTTRVNAKKGHILSYCCINTVQNDIYPPMTWIIIYVDVAISNLIFSNILKKIHCELQQFNVNVPTRIGLHAGLVSLNRIVYKTFLGAHFVTSLLRVSLTTRAYISALCFLTAVSAFLQKAETLNNYWFS